MASLSKKAQMEANLHFCLDHLCGFHGSRNFGDVDNTAASVMNNKPSKLFSDAVEKAYNIKNSGHFNRVFRTVGIFVGIVLIVIVSLLRYGVLDTNPEMMRQDGYGTIEKRLWATAEDVNFTAR